MKPMYRRSTARMSLSALPPEILNAVTSCGEANQLTIAVDSPVWATHSVNLRNRADKDPESDVYMVLGGADLVIVTAGAKRGVSALTLPLREASISEGSRLQQLTGHSEPGISITGFPGDNNSPGSFFVGLGTEPAAEECVQQLVAAVTAAKA
ncbi:hypothetical protein MYK68_09905 [Gordonia sp. PP30]|uniref:hypothetical protein n=1 Tax=unclassified Gordonia (in: high G+C Gram-positive bacteria) TaxID=2657482 RepID=UPI001FFEF951|nr:hypothetical protein [Gordonia sp. PP30]UQE76842.1 hypothetical protein MYK68_09905 [Gordonia sp. PP30]